LESLQTGRPNSPNSISFPHKLVFSGPKVSGANLKVGIPSAKDIQTNQPKLIGPHLRSLILKDSVKASKLQEALVQVLAHCPNLEELRVPASRHRLHVYLNRLQVARHLNPTVLRILDVTGGFLFSGQDLITVRELGQLVEKCPELEVLKLKRLGGLPLRSFPPLDAGTDTVDDATTQGQPLDLAQPMQPFPRLREFALMELRAPSSTMSISSETVQKLVPWLLAGMPQLESFTLSNGSHYLFKSERAMYKVPEYPSLGGTALATLPRTLQRLNLQHLDLAVPQDTLSHLMDSQDYPKLQHVQLDYCNNAPLSALSDLARRHGKLRVGVRKKAQRPYKSYCLSSNMTAEGLVPVEETSR